MNVSIPIIKAISFFSIILMSSFLLLSYLSSSGQNYSSRVVEAEKEDIKRAFKEIFTRSYFEEGQQIITVNLGKSELNLIPFYANFSISMPNERLEWNIKFAAICLTKPCAIDQNNLYSLNKEVIKENDATLIPTLNILSNITLINNLKIYIFFITQLTLNSSLTLISENQVRIETKKYKEEIARSFENDSIINFAINGKTFYFSPIEKNSIVIFYLTKITINIINI